MTDTCDWCGQQTNSLQITAGGPGLCPSCCPDVAESDVPDNAPSTWHHMSLQERADWLDGMSIEEIMEKYNWHIPPEQPKLQKHRKSSNS